MTPQTWLVALVAALALAGAIAFFLWQDLEQADQYASVAAFLLALLVAGVTAVAALRRRGPVHADEGGRGDGERRRRGGSQSSLAPLIAWRNGTVIKGGDGDTTTVINVNHSER